MMRMNRKCLSNMKFVATRSLLLGLFISLIGQSVLSADEEGFVSLFNGKDLSGWHITKEAPFTVKDGVIHLEAGSGPLLSDQKFRDFELLLDFRFVNGSGDSGVYIRSLDGQKYQIQTNSAFGPRGMGSIRAGKKEVIETTFDESVIPRIRRGKGAWYSYSIVVQGQRAAVSATARIALCH